MLGVLLVALEALARAEHRVEAVVVAVRAALPKWRAPGHLDGLLLSSLDIPQGLKAGLELLKAVRQHLLLDLDQDNVDEHCAASR